MAERRAFQDDLPGVIEVQRISDLDDPDMALTPAQREAWSLRLKADDLDGQISYGFRVRLPPEISTSDWWDALTFGMTAARQYLLDLRRDRVSG